MDITVSYPLTMRKNKYLLTFIDFMKYVEAFPIQDQSADSWARVYASQIVTRHGSGSKLITNQVSAFMSIFNETWVVLVIHKSRTSSYHPASNRIVKR
jgi:hypothetical protein